MARKHLIFALAALAAGTSAQADVGAAVTVDAGTTGLGLHLVVPMETYLNGRFGINYFKHDFDKRSSKVDYQVKGKLQTYDVLFDWYAVPQSSFRLTGGIMYNGNRVKAVAKPGAGGKFTFNGKSYTAADVGNLTGDVSFRRAAPYLGIGWGNALTPNKRLNFSTDIGVFYQGKGEVNLISRGCASANAVCNAVTRDVAVEEERLKDELADFKVYPVLRASLSYSF